MKRLLSLVTLYAFMFLSIQLAFGAINFTENFNEDGSELGEAEYIKREVPIEGGGDHFDRHVLELEGFSDETALPVSNGVDKELRWNNGMVVTESLALTPDDTVGNYPNMHVMIDAVFATVGDLMDALPDAGVVVRHTGGEEEGGNRKFYAAYGEVIYIDEELFILFHLAKWFGETGFTELDSGPAFTDPFAFSAAENFRVQLEVTERDTENYSHLTAHFFRLSVSGEGTVEEDTLAVLQGFDRTLALGQVGLYAEAGSMETWIAFDDVGMAVLSEPVSVKDSSWGNIKSKFK